MSISRITVNRFKLTSSKTFDAVILGLHAGVRSPYFTALRQSMDATATYQDFETLIGEVVGESGFMEFMRFLPGRRSAEEERRSCSPERSTDLGNPVVMAVMVELVPDAGSYAPVTILVDERSDGVHISLR